MDFPRGESSWFPVRCSDTQFLTGLLSAAKNLGLLRLMTAAAYANDTSNHTDHAREQMRMRINRRSLSQT